MEVIKYLGYVLYIVCGGCVGCSKQGVFGRREGKFWIFEYLFVVRMIWSSKLEHIMCGFRFLFLNGFAHVMM